jgi:hypothetical protein
MLTQTTPFDGFTTLCSKETEHGTYRLAHQQHNDPPFTSDAYQCFSATS